MVGYNPWRGWFYLIGDPRVETSPRFARAGFNPGLTTLIPYGDPGQRGRVNDINPLRGFCVGLEFHAENVILEWKENFVGEKGAKVGKNY